MDVSYKDLIAKFRGERIPYAKLLSANEWKSFREVILKRDNHTCQVCNAIETERIGCITFENLQKKKSFRQSNNIHF